MKKVIFVLFLSLGYLLINSASAFAQAGYSPKSVKVVTFSPKAGESKNFYTIWGEVVEIKGEVNGDVYVAAERVLIEGKVNGDVLAAGSKIDLTGEVTEDFRVVGAEVNISGKVGKNATVLSGRVEVSKEAEIDGGIITMASENVISGPVQGQVKIISESTILGNSIGSDVEVWTSKLRVLPGAKVGGDVRYYSENVAEIDRQASISGRVTKGSSPFVMAQTSWFEASKEMAKKGRVGMHVLGFLWAISWGVLLIRVTPKGVDAFSEVMQKSTGKSFFVGVLTLFLTPLLILFLVITIIGIPFAVIILLVFLLFCYLAKIYFSYWLGRKLVKEDKNGYLSMVTGVGIYYLATYIRVVGGLFAFFVLVFGLGGELLMLYRQYKSLSSKKLI
jgi:cytoskeletal protein CcmA (bactofilin family)